MSKHASSADRVILEGNSADLRAHFGELDALRGIAILMVFISHSTGYWMRYTGRPLTVPLLNVNVAETFQYGYLGVSLFFLLSGYLLTWTEGQRLRTGAYTLRSYAVRRFLRLVPANWFALVVVIIVWPTSPSIFDVLTQAFFLTGVSPYSLYQQGELLVLDRVTWSLTAEVVFYLMLPLIVLKLRRYAQRLTLLGILVAISLAVRLYIVQNAAEFTLLQPSGFSMFGYLYFLPVIHLYLFLVGALIRPIVEHVKENNLNVQPLAFILLSGSLLFFIAFPYLGMTQGVARQGPAGMLGDMAVIALFLAALLGTPILRGVLKWKPLVFVGTISYSMFLLHKTVLVVVYGFIGKDANRWAASSNWFEVWFLFAVVTVFMLVVSVFIAALSYRFVEMPFLKYKPK